MDRVRKRVITVTSNKLEVSIVTKNRLAQKLINAGFEVSTQVEPETELIVCIGGDGSFLRTMHQYHFPDIPVIAVNTGHLGFFAEIGPEKIEEFIESYINGEFFIQEVTLLKADIYTEHGYQEIIAINEVVIKNVASRTVHLDLQVNEIKMQKFSGDGILVATPIGSTAYNYSAGGSLVDPRLELFQITPLSPMNTKAYRCFTSSMILPSDSVITIAPSRRFEDSILIVVDGEEFRMNQIERIEFAKAKEKIKLLRLKNYEFWGRAADKFL